MAEVTSIKVKNAFGDAVDVATITALIALIGDLTADPPANSELGRLKALAVALGAVETAIEEGSAASVGGLDALADLIGEVGANPAANTLQARLKTLATVLGDVQASIDAGNTVLVAQTGMIDGLEALLTTLGATLEAANNRSVAMLGARTVALSPAVNIATDQPAISVDQKSTAHDVVVTLTRPANVTPYTAGDVVGQTAGGVLNFAAIGKAGGSILITRAELELDISALPVGMTSFRLYLYSSAPPSNLADNAAFTWTGTDRGPFLGYIDLGAPVLIGGGTLYCKVSGINEQYKLTGTDISAYLVTAGGYTPAANSEIYKVTLHSVDV
ncbi:hypothetical protein [Rhizobium leguminosarum]|uniref:hypothetical protein n=1 Tax=Rhizobium leguminosarum TaxID=384 RepID=UPI000B9284D1|nr:hypothetical protein [Rhizobium leguminosarum]ASS56897.1 hypothetical protein CHR56_21370 [Rhizobium leguminosarum bv. viciae]